MSDAATRQASFATPETKVRGVLKRAARVKFDTAPVAVSGGTDSALAAYFAATLGPEYGIDPDVFLHAHTGIAIPQTQLVVKVMAALFDKPYLEANDATIFERAVEDEYGWSPSTSEGHFHERIDRKSDVFDKFYSMLSGDQLWVSGARSTESKQRSTNVPDSGVEQDSRRARQTWMSPITGLTSEEKGQLILDLGLPVSESYLLLGISGECVACSFDDAGLLTDLDILAPNLAWALRNVTGLMATLARLGHLDITPKQLCWGWDPETDDTTSHAGQLGLDGEAADTDGRWIGCGGSSCGDRDIPDWIRDLPAWQIVDRCDVRKMEDGRGHEVVNRFQNNASAFA